MVLAVMLATVWLMPLAITPATFLCVHPADENAPDGATVVERL